MVGGKQRKRTRDQSSKAHSGISPPTKRNGTDKMHKKNNKQPPISDWIDIVEEEILEHSLQNMETVDVQSTDCIASASQFPSPEHAPLLSPISSQPRSSIDRGHFNNIPSPNSDALDFVASATSLSSDIQLCEKIMTEKHQFLIAMLDGMNKKVTGIADKIFSLEQRVEKIEQNDQHQINTARSIYQASNKRQNDLENELRTAAKTMNNMVQKFNTVSTFEDRISQLEQQLSQQSTKKCSHDCRGNTENNSVAIYGLPEYEEVTKATNRLFMEMNLPTRCKSAYRTPSRMHVNRVGVVIAELETLKDKQAILERKRFIRQHPQYANVFIKSAKSHVEQVMNANFNLILNEMSNGQDYFINDNGRMIKKSRTENNDEGQIRRDYNYGYSGYSGSHGGARPKTTQYNRTYNRYNGNSL